MNGEREREQERRINLLDRRLRLAEDRIAEAAQAIPRIQSGAGGGDGGSPHWFLARGDGAAQATGTFPTITPGSFTSDVLDLVTNAVVATGVDVAWWYTDPLTVDGALVWCVKTPDGDYIGVLEQCSTIALDA